MARLIRSDEVFQPNLPQPSADQTYSADPAQPGRLAAVALVVSAAASLIMVIAFWVPELSGMPGYRLVVEQLAPVTSPAIVSAGIDLTGLQHGFTAVAPAVLLIALLAQWLLIGGKVWVLRAAAAIFGSIAGLTAIAQVIVWAAVNGWSAVLARIHRLTAWVSVP